MDAKTRMLIVEDDMIIAANLSLQLSNLGYEVTGIESRGEEAIMHAKMNQPNIILMDINLKGRLDGVETAAIIQKEDDIPIIYLTANSDEATFARAKETRPYAFISKPFNKLDLQRTVALVAKQLDERNEYRQGANDIQVLEDRVFVRCNGKMTKLLLEDILYLEADRNYCTLVTNKIKHVLTSTLKTMEAELPRSKFIRVHRSYIINISKLDVVTDHHLEINRKVIPLGKSHKAYLLSRLHTI